MKLNNLASRAKNSALIGFIMTLAACQSDDQQLAQMDADITNIENQINSAYTHNEAVDSAARNPMLQFLGQWIDEDTPHIDSLNTRNNNLIDSIHSQQINRIAKKYPLRAFLSQREYNEIRNQLRTFHSKWNDTYATNIITGHGTLWDLYNVSFDLNYVTNEQPFHIETDMGYVRFNNAKLNKICQKFEAEKSALEKEDVVKKIRNKNTQSEFADNAAQIERFNHLCDMHDSIYIAIEQHFAPQIQHRIDSLKIARDYMNLKRAQLMQRINARNR